MVSVNKKTDAVFLSAGLVPVVFSIVFLVTREWVFLLLCVVALFALVALLPLCRHRENLYMFIFVTAAGLPINIGFSLWLVAESFIDAGFVIGNILWGILLCCVFFSVEQIAFGVVTRLIWKNQYKIKM